VFMLPLPSEEEPIPPGVTMLHLDVDPWEIGKNYPVAVGIQGDPKATLPELTEAVRRLGCKPKKIHNSARAELVAQAENEKELSQLAFAHAIAKCAPPEAVIVDESISISSSGALRQLLKCADAKSFFGPRGGGVGWGIPAALGVKLALPSRPVIALIGDGSALYSWQGLWSAVHDRIPVVFVIVNNRSYRILKERALALKGFTAADRRFVGVDLVDPEIDFIGLARAMGVEGERVERADGIAAAVRRGLDAGRPYVVDVAVSQGL
jgi:benzoylformate decarboxylase